MAEKKETREAELFRKYSAELKGAIRHPVDLADKLYSSQIIDEMTLKEIKKDKDESCLVDAVELYIKSRRKRGIKLVKEFEKILSIFKNYIPLDSVVEGIEEEYYGTEDDDDQEILDTKQNKSEMMIRDKKKHTPQDHENPLPQPTSKSTKSSTHTSHSNQKSHKVTIEESQTTTEHKTSWQEVQETYDVFSDPHLSKLAIALQVYSSDLNESGLNSETTLEHIKSRIETHIRQKLEDGLLKEDVMKHLSDLTMNALIPMDIIDWCYDKFEEIAKELDHNGGGIDEQDANDPVEPELPPLFSKDTVYHASLCALFVSQSHSEDDFMSMYGHSFDEMSVSVSDQHKIFIAQQGNIVYTSFANYKDSNLLRRGINEIHIEERKLPMRYFCELLYQGKRLIFTGFSFGGLLACCITVKLWNLPFFNSDILVHNVACIMFGPPCVDSLPYLKEAIHQFPEILQSFHSFHLKDDFIPKLYFFIDRGIDQHWLLSQEPLVMLEHIKRSFLSSRIHQILINFTYHGNKYSIQQRSDGIYWEKLQNLQEELFSITMIKKMDISNLNQHDMTVYHLKILRGYLEKEPGPYVIPQRNSSSSIEGVKSLLPSISKVELHLHKHPDGQELAVVINGDNLWFCNSIEIEICESELLKINISAERVSRKQISYNQSFHDETFTPEQIGMDHLPVKVYSRFANPIAKEVPMTYTEPDPISFRQSQLAKQTPSQIIKLSFLSALLEQSPIRASKPSKRFNLIIRFLQEAARIVPMESIVFAIGSCSTPAYKCAQAVLSVAHTSSLPVSKLMANGCHEGAFRLRSEPGFYHLTPSLMVDDLHEKYRYYSRELEYPGSLETVSYRSFFTPKTSVKPPPQWESTKEQRKYGKKRKPKKIPQQNQRTRSSRPHFTEESHFLASVPLKINPVNEKKLLYEFHPGLIAHYFQLLSREVNHEAEMLAYHGSLSLISGRNIGEAYPISEALSPTTAVGAFTPLPQILRKARQDLASLSTGYHKDAKLGSIATGNCDMLKKVNNIIENHLNPCVTMLGGFMEQQIRVPLVNNPLDTAKALQTDSSGAVGVWALFALDKKDIASILSSNKQNQPLVIQITKFIEGVLSSNAAERRVGEQITSYNAKLQFLLQGMNKTVTCSSQYISYSLERELVGICKERKITTKTKVGDILHHWDTRFEATALALVPKPYRPLLARWLIWALHIHQLREGLASYTTVGVIGLVNSGKSTLVNKIFGRQTVQGTTQAARTTVPFIYNLDDSVEGLSVIDFPGVDDRDESIAGLAKLLVGLAQIVIFVCGYERFHTVSAEEWMEVFQKDFISVPILVCLTHADRLYENSCEVDMIPTCPEDKLPRMKMQFEDELEKVKGNTPIPPTCTVKFCSLTQTRFSPLNCKDGRESMRKAGIFTPEDIGHWIKRVLSFNIQQQDLADKLDIFLKKLKFND